MAAGIITLQRQKDRLTEESLTLMCAHGGLHRKVRPEEANRPGNLRIL